MDISVDRPLWVSTSPSNVSPYSDSYTYDYDVSKMAIPHGEYDHDIRDSSCTNDMSVLAFMNYSDIPTN
jgi:hypothetical protein